MDSTDLQPGHSRPNARLRLIKGEPSRGLRNIKSRGGQPNLPISLRVIDCRPNLYDCLAKARTRRARPLRLLAERWKGLFAAAK